MEWLGWLLGLLVVVVLLGRMAAHSGRAKHPQPEQAEPEREEHEPGSIGAKRAYMQALIRALGPDEETLVQAYAAGEKAGEVFRKEGDYVLNAEEHARRLLADGRKKGWLGGYLPLPATRTIDPVATHAAAVVPSNRTRNVTVASYSFGRLCFRADVIEPLAAHDCFRVETPEGSYEMSKAQFYQVFDNVVASSSYRDKGIYHYPVTPEKARPFLVGR